MSEPVRVTGWVALADGSRALPGEPDSARIGGRHGRATPGRLPGQLVGRRWQLGGLVGACAIVGGCASTPAPAPEPAEPPQDPPPAPIVVLPPEPSPYELRQRERAQALARQGRLADAALIWEMLSTIRPKAPEYRERLAEVQKQIDAGVADRLQRGDQAAARGQVDAAMQQYLAALALQPDNARAADALRGMERERVRRAHLGKLSRNTLTRRAMSEAEMAPSDAPADTLATPGPTTKATGLEERNEVEHASLLASQGEWDEAIAMMERRLRANRRDDAARELLADVYFQKAEAVAARNRGAAVALLERSVRLDPRHPKAPERLRQLRPPAPTSAAPATPTPTTAPASSTVPAAAAAGQVTTPSTAPARTGAISSPPPAGALKPTGATVGAPAASAASPRR